jgi:O-acetyl-ADP-ribose deacetylase (regulator of RNase III)
MGAGLAKAAREKWPRRGHAYENACKRKELRGGGIIVDDNNAYTNRVVFYVATKDDWRKPSELHWVALAAKRLAIAVDDLALSSIAIPALGCGLGGLDWSEVEPVLRRAFGGAKGLKVLLYPPQMERKNG